MSLTMSMKYKGLRYELVLDNRITVVIGNSATGKTTILRVAMSRARIAAVKISDPAYGITLILTEDDFSKLKHNGKRIVIIDESLANLTNEVARAIRNSHDKYFLILSREPVSKINYSIDAVKELAYRDGVNVLVDKIQSTYKVYGRDITNLNGYKCIIEDTGYGRDWFIKLLENTDISIDKKSKGGKDLACRLADEQLSKGNKVLFIVDYCSFGSCATHFDSLLRRHIGDITLIRTYKSFEYLILKSNMYKDKFIPYTIDIVGFEESYYERLLSSLSNTGKARIRHESSSTIPKCYTEECCPYENRGVCKVGLSGTDKFVALLKGTEFEFLCRIAGRL